MNIANERVKLKKKIIQINMRKIMFQNGMTGYETICFN